MEEFEVQAEDEEKMKTKERKRMEGKRKEASI